MRGKKNIKGATSPEEGERSTKTHLWDGWIPSKAFSLWVKRGSAPKAQKSLYFIFRMRTSISGVPLSRFTSFDVSVSPK
jgi:hypothetical protein